MRAADEQQFSPLYRMVAAVDWGQPSTPWASQQAGLAGAPGVNATRLFGERGLLAARSDWSPAAVQLLFQPRSVRGGHSLADHNKIALAANGRWWAPYLPLSSLIPQRPAAASAG